PARGRDGRAARADEDDPRLLAGLREVRVLGQEAVAGVDGLRPAALRDLEDAVDPEVAVARGRRPDEIGLVGLADVEGEAVGLGVDGHRLRFQLAAGPDDPHRDLSAVRDEDLPEFAAHWRRLFRAECCRASW